MINLPQPDATDGCVALENEVKLDTQRLMENLELYHGNLSRFHARIKSRGSSFFE
jgi:hypothetical protein